MRVGDCRNRRNEKKKNSKVTVDLADYTRPGVLEIAGQKDTVGVCRINEKCETPVIGHV